MSDIEATVKGYYGRSRTLERVLDTLKQAGADPEALKPEDIYPFDQMHGRGIDATREHAELAGITAGMHVLDIGCGIGGASRYLATLGCRVSAIDLTPEFIEVARELTRRCGLAERIDCRVASALDLPFPDAGFDRVWCHNVTMNIADKPRLLAEVVRVLKPGGRFSCADVELGPAGNPPYPLTWASQPSSSFVVTPDEMRALVEASGLHILEQIDVTQAAINARNEAARLAERGEPPRQNLAAVNADDFPQRARNRMRGLREGRLVEQVIVAEKL